MGKNKRGNKNVIFVALNDGSTVNNIQIVFDMSLFTEETLRPVTTGSCIAVEGTLVASPGGGQSVEISATNLVVYGTADPETYPLQKKGHSMEFLREIGHLRPRTNTFGCIFRIRHAMALLYINSLMKKASSIFILLLSPHLMQRAQEQCFRLLH